MSIRALYLKVAAAIAAVPDSVKADVDSAFAEHEAAESMPSQERAPVELLRRPPPYPGDPIPAAIPADPLGGGAAPQGVLPAGDPIPRDPLSGGDPT